MRRLQLRARRADRLGVTPDEFVPFPGRTLPYRLDPQPGESLVGYLIRCASALDVTVPVLVHRLGLSEGREQDG